VLRGESDEPAFAPGHTFTLNSHPRHDGDKVLIEVEHRASQTVAGWGLSPDDVSYHNRFMAIDATRDYRPPRVTPIPRIPGLVVGIIETGQGLVQDHAIIDADGRYMVRFLFDAAAPGARAPSLPVRMLQAHAGESYGIHFPLKPGIEVAIGFIDGNPDRPVIVGAAPNEHMIPPVTLADKTKSRIQTRTGILIEFDDHTRMP
jgi:type VI secretion system secreted protein VgrG